MTSNWQHWQQPSPPHSVEIEHRLTSVETTLEHAQEACEDRHEEGSDTIKQVDSKHEAKHEAIAKRMSLLEKAVLALAAAMQVIAQDKYPALAKAIRGILTQ